MSKDAETATAGASAGPRYPDPSLDDLLAALRTVLAMVAASARLEGRFTPLRDEGRAARGVAGLSDVATLRRQLVAMSDEYLKALGEHVLAVRIGEAANDLSARAANIARRSASHLAAADVDGFADEVLDACEKAELPVGSVDGGLGRADAEVIARRAFGRPTGVATSHPRHDDPRIVDRRGDPPQRKERIAAALSWAYESTFGHSHLTKLALILRGGSTPKGDVKTQEAALGLLQHAHDWTAEDGFRVAILAILGKGWTPEPDRIERAVRAAHDVMFGE